MGQRFLLSAVVSPCWFLSSSSVRVRVRVGEANRARSGSSSLKSSGKKSAQAQLIDLLKEQQQQREARSDRMLALQERETGAFLSFMDRLPPPRGGQSE